MHNTRNVRCAQARHCSSPAERPAALELQIIGQHFAAWQLWHLAAPDATDRLLCFCYADLPEAYQFAAAGRR